MRAVPFATGSIMVLRRFLPLVLAAAAAAQTAYVVDSTQDKLFTVDLATGTTVLVGSTNNHGLETPADLCWRPDTGELCTIDFAGGEVGTLDPHTGTFTARWLTGRNGWQAMAWDATTRQFLLHNQDGSLWRLDPGSGATTRVGALATSTALVTGLAVTATGDLLALDYNGALLPIDKATGLQSGPALPTVAAHQGMSFDAEGRLFAINSLADALYRLDPVTGTSTLVGITPGITFARGLAIPGTAWQRGGTPCADGSGCVRRLTHAGSPAAGATLLVGAETGNAARPCLLLGGASCRRAGDKPLPFDLGLLGAPGCTLYTSAEANFGPSVTGTACALHLPTDPRLYGTPLWLQAAVFDSTPTANAVGIACTDVLRVTLTP